MLDKFKFYVNFFFFLILTGPSHGRGTGSRVLKPPRVPDRRTMPRGRHVVGLLDRGVFRTGGVKTDL